MISCAVLGVDPGVRGGMAVIQRDGSPIQTWTFKPVMRQDELVHHVRSAVNLLRLYGGCHAYFEKVGYRPTDGGKGAFTFGRVVGLLAGALLANSCVIHEVAPMIWQTKLDCLTGGNKNVSKSKAQELFPSINVTHAIADALLIAEFGRRMLASHLG